MLVVSDTSPISNLAIINRLNLLPGQFKMVWISGAVEAELQKLPDSSALAKVELAKRQGWIGSRKVTSDSIVRLLESGLDKVEAETITLGIEMSAELVLLDERDGRMAAERAGLRVLGALGILLRAKKQGDISAIRPDLEALRSKAHFFIAPRLEEQVLRSADEGY
jgi:predicted nucleic acid-binding protein